MTKRVETFKTPKQVLFLAKYHDPKSDTYCNAYRSALVAGYKENYAANITDNLPKWLLDSVGQNRMLSKAERNIDKFLDLETKEPVITMIGELKDKEGNTIMKENGNLMRIKLDTTKFVAERIGRKIYGQQQAGPSVAIQFNVGDARGEFTQ